MPGPSTERSSRLAAAECRQRCPARTPARNARKSLDRPATGRGRRRVPVHRPTPAGRRPGTGPVARARALRRHADRCVDPARRAPTPGRAADVPRRRRPTTAARAGVPQVVVPRGGDQVYWARRVAELGIGAAHDGPTPTVQSLSVALRTVLTPEASARATAVAADVGVNGASTAAELLIAGDDDGVERLAECSS
ncbi:nucleotide disphospho-sugar-binding domain-containing protein [Geodermatophilus sabuli]|uniref:nucleotide disphospho-sugar-binding domain-containing protein n=1 Tax=Geodermatophilus sabuli TaxID=1564158 RepID=UPI003F7F4A15